MDSRSIRIRSKFFKKILFHLWISQLHNLIEVIGFFRITDFKLSFDQRKTLLRKKLRRQSFRPISPLSLFVNFIDSGQMLFSIFAGIIRLSISQNGSAKRIKLIDFTSRRINLHLLKNIHFISSDMFVGVKNNVIPVGNIITINGHAL